MTNAIHRYLFSVMPAAIVAAGAVLHCQAEIVSNCFKVVDYSVCWHIECTLDGFDNALDIVIDDNAPDGFRAGDHGSRAYAYFAAAESGETIDAGTFMRMAGSVEFANQSDFVVAFAIGCSERNRIDGNFGWVRLSYEGGTIILKGGAINTTLGSPLVVEGGEPPSVFNPETGCETNTFYATSGQQPHILHRRDASFDFVVFNYEGHRWGVGVEHGNGRGYVATVSAGTRVDDSTFSQQSAYDGYEGGDLFFLAFKWWPDANDTTSKTRYGWLAIGLKDGTPAVLASEMSETAGAPLVARGFEGGDTPGGDEPGGTDDEESDDLIFDWVVVDRGDYLELGEQTKPAGTSGKVTIPSEIGGKTVASIGEGAFCGHGEITSAVIPETVSNIGYKAFSNCIALKSCNIPSGVTNIGYGAFSHTDLGEIVLPDGVVNVSEYAFEGCQSLTNATMGSSVTNIGEMAFFGTSLTNVVIPARVEAIGQGAFWNCPGLKEVHVWPWTHIADESFDSICEVRYTGTVTNFTRFAREFGDLEVTNLMMIVGREHFDGVAEFRVYDEDGERAGNQHMTSKILYYTGIAPGVVSKNGGVLEARYAWPRIEIVSFDPAARRITGRVVPQGGCRIVAKPEMPWQLGIRRFDKPGADGVNDWSAVPDVSGYADAGSLGEFTHVISEEDFATNKFFRLELTNW